MPELGIFEIFYGQAWSTEDRLNYPAFLRDQGYQFYVYGPKSDESLRTKWQEPFTVSEISNLKSLKAACEKSAIKFGVALSPQGLQSGLSLAQRNQLISKSKILSDLGADILGIFFDDMNSSENMAEIQLEAVHALQPQVSSQIIFCPSYYTHDTLLDFLFGDRPENYLDSIGKNLHSAIDILWTGEQIISPQITTKDLIEVQKILRRKPFICDNFYANDGPMNCTFLKLQPPKGRNLAAFQESRGWGVNPMNQAQLSKILLQAFSQTLLQAKDPQNTFTEVVQGSFAPPAAKLILSEGQRMSEMGLSSVTEDEKLDWTKILSQNPGPREKEILMWLEGKYAVDLSVVLEQIGFDT